MNINGEIAIIENLEKLWSQFPKNQIWEEISNGETRLMLAWEAEELRMLLTLIIGKRKGIREHICVLDISKNVLIDKLLLAEVTTVGDGYLLPLREIRSKVRGKKQDSLTLCHEHMEILLKDIIARHEWYVAYIRRMEQNSMSTVAIVRG